MTGDWAKMTDPKSNTTCHVLELSDGRLAYDFGEPLTAQIVPDDVVPPDYWKSSRAMWAANEMLIRRLNANAKISREKA